MEFKIFTTDGRIIRSGSLTMSNSGNATIGLSGMKQGSYIFQVNDGKAANHFKFIKK